VLIELNIHVPGIMWRLFRSFVCRTSCIYCPYLCVCCSNYCMQEIDVAYHHNIMVKRKKRLVVLMALDSPTDLYAYDASDTAALRHYLRQVRLCLLLLATKTRESRACREGGVAPCVGQTPNFTAWYYNEGSYHTTVLIKRTVGGRPLTNFRLKPPWS